VKLSTQSLQFPRTAIRVVSYLLVLLPAIFGFLYVHSFGVNVVMGDSWSMVTYFDQLSSGTLRLSDLLALHNGHWMLFPRIAWLLLGTITEWNSVAEMYLTQACLLGSLICFLLAFRNSIKPNPVFTTLFMIPISLLVFSFVRAMDFLRGFHVTFAFAEVFGVLALYLLYVLRFERFRRAVFVTAVGSAMVASFSAAAGLLVWPAGLLGLSISPLEKPMKRVFIALWALAGLGVWIAYLITLARSEHEGPGSMLAGLAHPLTGIKSFLKLLGSPLFGKELALPAGLLMVCLVLVSLFLIYKDERGLGAYSFWVSSLFWSLLILASIVAVRFARATAIMAPQPLTPEYLAKVSAVAPRYTTFTILTTVSIYGLLATAVLRRRLSVRRPNIGTILLVLLSGVVLLSAGIHYPRGIKKGNRDIKFKERAALVLSKYESRPNEVLEKYFRQEPECIREDAEVLARLEYNVFSEVSSSPSSSGPSPASPPTTAAPGWC
jgi:hypothetical protein